MYQDKGGEHKKIKSKLSFLWILEIPQAKSLLNRAHILLSPSQGTCYQRLFVLTISYVGRCSSQLRTWPFGYHDLSYIRISIS